MSVSTTRRPSEQEKLRSNEQMDYFCGRLSTACPEIGAWESSESYRPGGRQPQYAGFFAGFGLASICAWGLFRLLRRRPRLPSPPGHGEC